MLKRHHAPTQQQPPPLLLPPSFLNFPPRPLPWSPCLRRYQLQVALRAAQKQHADALAALAAAEASAAAATAAAAAAAAAAKASPRQLSAEASQSGRLSQLEGALRQAMTDYQMLLSGEALHDRVGPSVMMS